MARPAWTFGVLFCFLTLSWVGFSSTYVAFPDMILQTQCRDLGIPEGQCNARHELFSRAQADQSRFLTQWSLLTTIPGVFLSTGLAHLSDVIGRKPVLIFLSFQGMFAPFIILWAGLEDHAAYAAAVVFMNLGNVFVGNSVTFAALADTTAECSAEDRSRRFSLLEGAAWVGQLIGPLCGGLIGSALGPRKAQAIPLATCAALFAVNALCFSETLPRERRASFSWSASNPVGMAAETCRFPRCALLAAGLLFAQWGISSGITTWPLFCKSMFDWADGTTGALESTFFAANAVGLATVPPLLSGRLQPTGAVGVAAASAMLMWLLFSTVSAGWQMFPIACLGATNAMIYPVIRSIIATEFGPSRYGAASGIVSLVEIICQCGSPAVATATWQAFKSHGLSDLFAFRIVAAEFAVAIWIFISAGKVAPSNGEAMPLKPGASDTVRIIDPQA